MNSMSLALKDDIHAPYLYHHNVQDQNKVYNLRPRFEVLPET